MSAPKTIAVLGATGNQGGSVADTFLRSGWRVRAITRNPSSSKAQQLAARGAEVVRADLDVPSTLAPVFQGAQVVFAVSDFWGLYGDPANQDKPKPGQALNAWAAEHETQQLKNVIDVVAAVDSLERFVISSLSNATRWSGGKYTHVYHFDSKANAVDYGKEAYPALWEKTSIFQAGAFLSNYVINAILQPKKNEKCVVQFIGHMEPRVKLPFIAAEEDSGPIVEALVADKPGKNVIGYREWLDLEELIKVFTAVTGHKAEAVRLPKGEWHIPLSEDLALELEDNFSYWSEFGYEGRDDPTVIHPSELKEPPKLGTVSDYFKKQDWSKALGL